MCYLLQFFPPSKLNLQMPTQVVLSNQMSCHGLPSSRYFPVAVIQIKFKTMNMACKSLQSSPGDSFSGHSLYPFPSTLYLSLVILRLPRQALPWGLCGISRFDFIILVWVTLSHPTGLESNYHFLK